MDVFLIWHPNHSNDRISLVREAPDNGQKHHVGRDFLPGAWHHALSSDITALRWSPLEHPPVLGPYAILGDIKRSRVPRDSRCHSGDLQVVARMENVWQTEQFLARPR